MHRLFLCFFALLVFSLAFAQSDDCREDELQIAPPNGAVPYTSLELNNDRCQFQFAIVTDRTGGHRPGVFMEGVNKLNLLQPEFVMSVGDLIEGYTEDTTELNRQWNEFTGFVEALEMPFFYVPGNHDITNEVMEKVYLDRFGKTYYHFVYKEVLFLCLNTEDQYRGSNKGTISDEQYQYIQQVLKENESVRWTMVFMHQPLWILEDTKRWQEVESLLAARKHSVFVGHHHHYVKYERNNGKYIMLATTGGSSYLRGPQLGEFDHVVWVTMTDNGPILANLALEGIHDENVFTEKAQDFFQAVMQRNPIRIEPLFTEEAFFKNGSILVKAFNNENIPMQIEWDKSFSWDLKASFDKATMSIPPNSVDTLRIALETRKEKQSLPGLKALPLQATVRFESDEFPDLSIPFEYQLRPAAKHTLPKMEKKVKIDGLLKEWTTFPYSLEGLPENSLAAHFNLAYDDDFFYIAAQVEDDQLVLDTGEVAWRQDFIGIVLNADPLVESTMDQGKGWYENSILFTIAPATDQLPASIFYEDKLPKGTQYVCKAKGNAYTFEAAIPLSYLKERQGEQWRTARFNLIVQDRDGKAENWPRYTFMPDWRGGENYIGSGMFFRE
jgi:hypothetical protein